MLDSQCFFLHASASNYDSAILSKVASLGKNYILFCVPLIVGVKKNGFHNGRYGFWSFDGDGFVNIGSIFLYPSNILRIGMEGAFLSLWIGNRTFSFLRVVLTGSYDSGGIADVTISGD